MFLTEILVYIALFTSLYFAIFVFYTFFEYRGKIYYTSKKKGLPLVALIVPCYNEEENIEKAIESLRHLDYPQEKLEMIIIDDGSKDKTFLKAIKLAEIDKRIEVFRKENGGKYTALNFGMEKITKAKFVGTVDADSYLHPQSLKRIMKYFENSKIMAVIATVKIAQPKNILEGMQCVEYLVGAFLRKIFSFLDSVNVVPGPLSVFRKKVFKILGPYKNGHQTEDLELAFRMQKANFKIAHAIDAIVYTKGCKTFSSLLWQRLRWRRGFLLNLKDYPWLLNPKQHGNLSFLLLNSLFGSFISIVLFFCGLWKLGILIGQKVNQILLVKFDFLRFSFPKFDWISFNLSPILFLGIISLGIFFVYLIFSKKFTADRELSKRNVIFYIFLFPYLNAIWWLTTIFSLFTKKEVVWK